MSRFSGIFKRQTRADVVFSIIIGLLGTFIFICVAYPLYFVILASFSDPIEVASGKVFLWSKNLSLYGYGEVFRNSRIWLGYRNTIIYTTLGTMTHLAVTLPVAYVLSRKNVLWKGPLSFLFTIALFFNGGMVPTYFVYKSYNMLDTLWVMILPGCLGIYNTIIARTFFQSNIPDEILNAAQIDGCSDFRFFVSFVLPLSSAIIAVIALYYAVGAWNGYMDALLYLRSKNSIPLQIVLREILITTSNEQEMLSADMDVKAKMADAVKYCVIVIATLPLMVVYPFLQKYFNKGVMIGAVKG